MADLEVRAGLESPPRLEIPFFAYGPLQPGQPGFDFLLAALEPASNPGRTNGGLRVRAGLPLLDPTAGPGVQGALVNFGPGRGAEAYGVVSRYAPRQHYRWLAVPIGTDGGGEQIANTLVGRHPERGSAEEWFQSWSAGDEPVFGYGMNATRRLALTYAVAPVVPGPADDPAFWERFFGLHAAFSQLWLAVDRFSALAFGPADEPLNRLYRLGDDPRFRECVIATGVAASPKTPDGRDPQRSRRIRADGSGAMFSWEAQRSNLSHLGTTAFSDGILLRRALIELHDSFRLLLLNHLPQLVPTWTLLDPDGQADRWLLRPVVSADGLG